MKRVNPNLYFPGGYQYREVDGTLLKASSWRSLYAKVAEYRRINGKPPGDPENEVQAQACARSPQLCHDDKPAAPAPRTEKQRNESLKSAVLRWMSEIVRKIEKGEAVLITDEGLAGARADVCRRCPLQTEVGGGCGSCKAAVKGMATKIRGKRAELPGSGCSFFQTHTPSMARLEIEAVREAALPPECWRKIQ